MLLMAPIACARARMRLLFRRTCPHRLPVGRRAVCSAFARMHACRRCARRHREHLHDGGAKDTQEAGRLGLLLLTTSLMRECTSLRARALSCSSAESMFAIKKAASWLLAAQFFNATTVVSCIRDSCSPCRHSTSALITRVCLTIVCAPSSELAPQLPSVMAAYSRAPLCSYSGLVSPRISASESSAPGVCTVRAVPVSLARTAALRPSVQRAVARCRARREDRPTE